VLVIAVVVVVVIVVVVVVAVVVKPRMIIYLQRGRLDLKESAVVQVAPDVGGSFTYINPSIHDTISIKYRLPA